MGNLGLCPRFRVGLTLSSLNLNALIHKQHLKYVRDAVYKCVDICIFCGHACVYV